MTKKNGSASDPLWYKDAVIYELPVKAFFDGNNDGIAGSRFSLDAAHELRTPLTIIRGELELVASGQRLPPDIDNAISNALEEMTRLSGIVDRPDHPVAQESLWGASKPMGWSGI